MDATITDLLSSAIEVVDLTFADLGGSFDEISASLGDDARHTLSEHLDDALKDNFGSRASADLKVDSFSAEVSLTVFPEGSPPDSVTLGVPHQVFEALKGR